jgi:peptide-methionine (R)-S-oxide reductase
MTVSTRVTRLLEAITVNEGEPMPPQVQIGPIVKVTKTDEEWKKQLPVAAYRVLRHEDTERPFVNPLHENHQSGIYYCAGCDLPLFSSEHKFDSRTGWPSFWQPIDPRVIETRTDFTLFVPRTEVHCARCEGHQGHVFKDGPRPTGLRYCINGVALRFAAD